MRLFIFKIHEDCSYVDGMATIVAMTPEEACGYLKAIKDNEVWPSMGQSCTTKLIDEEDVVSLVKHQGDRESLDHKEWYIADSFLVPDYTREGMRCVAYHDG